MAQVHAVLVPAETHSLVGIKFDFELTLKNLQKAVGGYIQVVPMTLSQRVVLALELGPLVGITPNKTLDLVDAVLYVDEEGQLKDLPVNAAMSEIMGFTVHGDCIVTKMVD